MVLMKTYKHILALLAIVLAFSTVVAERVNAGDVHSVTNVIYTHETTGGVSVQGENGEDGERGEDGENGERGEDGEAHGEETPETPGVSGATVESRSSASIRVESTESGVRVLDIQRTDASPIEVDTVAPTHTPTSTEEVEIQVSLLESESEVPSSGVLTTLKDVFLSLQLMLVTYVSELF